MVTGGQIQNNSGHLPKSIGERGWRSEKNLRELQMSKPFPVAIQTLPIRRHEVDDKLVYLLRFDTLPRVSAARQSHGILSASVEKPQTETFKLRSRPRNLALCHLMDQMDVDPSSSSKRPAGSSPSSPADKRPKILPDGQLAKKLSSNTWKWKLMVKAAKADDSLWLVILSDVLILAGVESERANEIANNVRVNEGKLEAWKVAMWNGVERNDWIDLLARRTYISDYQIIWSHLIASTAELKIPTYMPNITPAYEVSRQQEQGTLIENLPLVRY